MPKVRSPLFSLDAKGTIGKQLTFTSPPGMHRAIKIPTHPDAQSLRQLYPRWTYKDAINYWKSLSPAQKATYHTQAVRHGLPDMAYFLSIYLKAPLDLSFYARLDTWNNVTIPDDSQYANHGTNFGSTRSAGRIDGARYFDGSDDRIDFGDEAPFKDITDYLTIGCFVYPDGSQNNACSPFYKYMHFGLRWTAVDTAYLILWANAASPISNTLAVTPNACHLIAATYNIDTAELIFYVDDQATAPVVAAGDPLKTDGGKPLLVGSNNLEANRFFKGWVDDPFIYHRVLSHQQILERAQRRYPLT